MGIFKDSDQFYACVGGLLEKIKQNPELYQLAADADMVARFRCADPDAVISIDTRKGVNEIRLGDEGPAPDIELSMPADLAHQFWMGKLNVLAETLAGRISYRGPLKKMIALIPLLKPAMKLYPQHLRDIGFLQNESEK